MSGLVPYPWEQAIVKEVYDEMVSARTTPLRIERGEDDLLYWGPNHQHRRSYLVDIPALLRETRASPEARA